MSEETLLILAHYYLPFQLYMPQKFQNQAHKQSEKSFQLVQFVIYDFLKHSEIIYFSLEF